MQKTNVDFLTDDGLTLRGRAYVPDSASPSPVVILTHGFATNASPLEGAAEYLASNGFGVLLYDHRTFGRSDGQPRQEVDPVAQYRDMQTAISFAQSFEGFDPERVALWGTSFSGAHVLAATALDRRVKAVVAQVPFISGYETFLRMGGAGGIAAFASMIEAERLSALEGNPPARMKVTRHPDDESAEFALFSDADTYDYLVGGDAGSSPDWTNDFTVRSLARTIEYDIRHLAKRISPAAMLMILTPADTTTPSDLALQFYEDALEPKKLVLLDGDHYSMYRKGDKFEEAMDAAVAWFRQNL